MNYLHFGSIVFGFFIGALLITTIQSKLDKDVVKIKYKDFESRINEQYTNLKKRGDIHIKDKNLTQLMDTYFDLNGCYRMLSAFISSHTDFHTVDYWMKANDSNEDLIMNNKLVKLRNDMDEYRIEVKHVIFDLSGEKPRKL